jgi:hypothetical protein
MNFMQESAGVKEFTLIMHYAVKFDAKICIQLANSLQSWGWDFTQEVAKLQALYAHLS